MHIRPKLILLSTLLSALTCFILTFLFILEHKEPEKEAGDAFGAFEWWYAQRASSNGLIPNQALANAYRTAPLRMKREQINKSVNNASSQWQSIGPNNVAGRILSLAIDPSNTNILWAGSSSGGLWKSTTKGAGINAWTYINTGYPTIAISAIAINQSNPSTMYIGTGEISYYHVPLVGTPGARASYGMGILKSTDAGVTWTQTSLTFDFSQITAIQRIVINPLNTNTLFAATSEGIYKSTDAGTTWSQSLFVVMAMDLVMNPADTSVLISAHGNLNSSLNAGMYKTTDAGETWTQLTTGLPSMNFGRTALSYAPSNSQVVYAGISNGGSYTMLGLYKSTDNGNTWALVSNSNYVGSQGWYNNVVAVHPLDENIVFCAGIDMYKSTNGGPNMINKSYWTHGYFYYIPPGGPEGDSLYVHADHHALVFDPTDPNIIYFGTDGGVFQSTNGGEKFAGRNGGLVTAQFFNGFANSYQHENIAYGGLQDNGVLKYTGLLAWNKVDAGDGGWCAIDPRNENIVYDEYVYLSISKSVNGGASFMNISSGLENGSSNANFVAPFVISPSEPDILYAGGKKVFKSTNGGVNNWFATNNNTALNGTKISAIGVSWTSPDTLIATTGAGTYNANPAFQAFLSKNGGTSWTNVTGILPARFGTDIFFHPKDSKTAFITYSGYGTGHVFKTTNLGQTWTDISSNLPDAPAQSFVIDPEETTHYFVGTDLGVFNSTDAGLTWNDFNAGMPITMVTDVTIYAPTGMLRATTFGNGVYQRKLPRTPELTLISPTGGETFIGGTSTPITWTQKYCSALTILYSPDMGTNWDTVAKNVPPVSGYYLWNIPTDSTQLGLIRLCDTGDTSITSTLANPFTIIENPDVLAGWNLLSVHIDVPDRSKNALFPSSATEAYLFNRGYYATDSLSNGYGYWLKFNRPEHITFRGDSLFVDTVQLKQKWNLIGSISVPIGVDEIQEDSAGLIASNVFGYDGNGYSLVDTILPMHGYWIKAKNEGKIVLKSAGLGAKRARNVQRFTLFSVRGWARKRTDFIPCR